MLHSQNDDFQAVRITVDGAVERIGLDRNHLLQSFYTEIGCRYVEVVQPTDTICIWIDEEGLLNGSAPNVVATLVAAALGFFGQTLRGTALVTGGGDAEGNTLPLSDLDLRLLMAVAERISGVVGQKR